MVNLEFEPRPALMICALNSMEHYVIVSGLKILKINGLSVTDTMIDPSTILAFSPSPYQPPGPERLFVFPGFFKVLANEMEAEANCNNCGNGFAFPNKKSKGRRCPCALYSCLGSGCDAWNHGNHFVS